MRVKNSGSLSKSMDSASRGRGRSGMSAQGLNVLDIALNLVVRTEGSRAHAATPSVRGVDREIRRQRLSKVAVIVCGSRRSLDQDQFQVRFQFVCNRLECHLLK
jgi:hypothetical protein